MSPDDQRPIHSFGEPYSATPYWRQEPADRIDVEAGNKITIKYKVSSEQFMSADQASAWAGENPVELTIMGSAGLFLFLVLWYYLEGAVSLRKSEAVPFLYNKKHTKNTRNL